ncbi:hypothetical protein GJ496_009746, partial [Pomphorhynchus laevis]
MTTTFMSSCSNDDDESEDRYGHTSRYNSKEDQKSHEHYSNFEQTQQHRRRHIYRQELSHSPMDPRICRSSSLNCNFPTKSEYRSVFNIPIQSTKSSFVDIPIHRRYDDFEMSRNLSNHKTIYQSLPALSTSKASTRGHWPSNVTSITTRSIVRHVPALYSISESEVIEKTSEENRSTRHRTHHRIRSKHHDEYRHSADRHQSFNEYYNDRTPTKYESDSRYNRDSRRRYSETQILDEEKRFHANILNELTSLLRSTEDCEDKLLGLSYISSSADHLIKLADELTKLQSKARFDGSIVDRLLSCVDRCKQESRKIHDSQGDKMLHDISKAVRRWEDVLTEIDTRQRLADSVLRVSKKCELLLTIEEGWFNGVQREEQRIRNFLNGGQGQESVAIQSLTDLIDEINSHTGRLDNIKKLCSQFADLAEVYSTKVDQYQGTLIHNSTSQSEKNLHQYASHASEGSGLPIKRLTTCLLSGRVERLSRNFNDLSNSCIGLVEQLRNLLDNKDHSLSMLNQKISALQNQASFAEPYISPVRIISIDTIGIRETNNKPSTLAYENQGISATHEIKDKNDRILTNGKKIIYLKADDLCLLGRQKIVYDPSTSDLISLNDMVLNDRLRFTKKTDPSNKSQMPFYNCYILADNVKAISKLPYCVCKSLEAALCRSGGFYINQSSEISLIEAIAIGMLDLKNGCVRNINDLHDALSLEEAHRYNYIDDKGINSLNELFETVQQLRCEDCKLLLQELQNSFSDFYEDYQHLYTICDAPLSLEEYFNLNLIEPGTGNIIDCSSGRSISLSTAIDQKIIASDLNEIVYTGSLSKLTIKEAIDRKIIEPGLCPTLCDAGNRINMYTAVSNGFIEKPVSLAEAFVLKIIDESGKIMHERTSQKLSFGEAIHAKLLDTRSADIVHPISKTLLSITDAIQLKLIDINGYFHSPIDNTVQTIYDAVKLNKLQLIALKPTVKGAIVKNTLTNRMVSIGEAIESLKIIDLLNYTYTDLLNNQKITINEAINRGFILASFHVYMSKVIHSKEPQINGKTVRECLTHGNIQLLANALCLKHIAVDARKNRKNQISEVVPLSTSSSYKERNEDDNIKSTAIFMMTIPDAVKCEIVSSADAAFLREMRGAITREAYIIAYFENGISSSSTKLEDKGATSKHSYYCVDDIDSLEIMDRSLADHDGGGKGEGRRSSNRIASQRTENQYFVLRPPIASVDGFDAADIISFQQNQRNLLDPNKICSDVAKEAAVATTIVLEENRPKHKIYSSDYVMTSTNSAAQSPQSFLHMNFIDAVNIQLLNIDTGKFKHPLTGKYISIREAIKQQLVNPCTAFVIDQNEKEKEQRQEIIGRREESGRSYNLQEAVNEGLITDDNQVFDRKSRSIISFAEAMKKGIMRLSDSSLSYYNIISKTESLSIKSVKDTQTGLYIDPNKAIKLNILDLHQGSYFDRANNRRKYSIDDAIQLGLIIVEDLSKQQHYDRGRNAQFKGSENLVSTSLIRETRSYNLVGVIDALSREEMSVQEAIDAAILDKSEGQYFDRKRKRWIPIGKAINDHLIKVTLVPVSASTDKSKRAVSETRTYTLKKAKNTKTGQLISIREAIEDGIIDQRTGLYYDTDNNVAMPISLAVERSLILTEEDKIDTRKHMCTGPTYLRRNIRYLSIEGAIDPETRQMLTVDEAIHKGILDTHNCSFLSIIDGKSISLTDAYSKGYLIGKYINEEELLLDRSSLIARVCREERSYLISFVLDTKTKTKLSLSDAIDRGLFNTDRAVYINPVTSEESSLADAIINGFVDAKMIDGSTSLTNQQQRASSTKVIRVQKRTHVKEQASNASDVYKMDTVEEFVEAMRSSRKSDLQSDGQSYISSFEPFAKKYDNLADREVTSSSSSVTHNTYHTVRHKERSVHERDIVIQPESPITPRKSSTDAKKIEEVIIDGIHSNERVIDVRSTPCSTALPIVIEESRPKTSSHIIIIDDDRTSKIQPVVEPIQVNLRADDIKVYTNKLIHDSRITSGTELPVQVRSRSGEVELSTEATATESLEIYPKKLPLQVSTDKAVKITTIKRTIKRPELSPIFIQSTSVDDVDDQAAVNQQNFINEILKKAENYRSSISSKEITSKSLIDKCTYVMKGLVHTLSWVLDPETRQKISLDEGIERRVFTTHDMIYHDTVENRNYDTEQAVRLGLIGTDEDCSPVILNVDGIVYTIHWVLDPIAKQRILPHKAVDKGVLDTQKLRYFNPQNNVSISIHEAVKMKFIGADEKKPDSNEISITINGQTIVFSWVLDTIIQKRINVYDALKRGLIDISTGVYYKQNTGDVMTLWDALQTGFIGLYEGDLMQDSDIHKSESVTSLDEDELTISTKTATYVITGVIHPVSQQELKVSDAIELGILDKNTGSYHDISSGITYELSDAINDGLMYATIVESKESTEMETSSIKHVIQRFIINKVIDPRDGKVIGGLQAQAEGILSYTQGLYIDPDTKQGISIREAIDKTLIEVELINQTSDEQFELELITDSLLERRITTFNIFNVIDPIIEQNISAQEAVNRGILDSDTKTYFNAGTGQYYELLDALAKGFLQADVKEKVVRKPLGLTLQNASRLGFYNYDT